MQRRTFVTMLLSATPMLSLANDAKYESGGIKVPADQDRFGKARSIGFNATTFKVGAADTAGALFVMEQHATKPGGPPSAFASLAR